MSYYQTCFDHSFSAWEKWILLDAESRAEQVEKAVENLPCALQEAAKYQLKQSRQRVEQVHQLIGPTGETNELYMAGRGVALLVVDSEKESALLAVVAMLTSILVAGNSVIVCCDNDDLKSSLNEVMGNEALIDNLVQIISLNGYKNLLERNIGNFAYIGHEKTEIEINKQLASRVGAIIALVSETDLEGLQQSQDPALVLRFVTERTRTINITAVGGNATLLELGNA